MLCYLGSIPEFEKLLLQEPDFAVYKFNSAGCRISKITVRVLLQSVIEKQYKHIYLVDIKAHPDLSQYIADQTTISHESPQFLIFHNGQITAHTSHMHITEEFVTTHFLSSTNDH